MYGFGKQDLGSSSDVIANILDPRTEWRPPQILSTFRNPENENRIYVRAACFCGKIFEARKYHLESGNTTSCGCRRKLSLRVVKSKHCELTYGKKNSPELSAYYHARRRCHSRSCKDYKDYGGRGIRFLFGDFQEFLETLGRRPSDKHSLDRIDPNGDYCPANVRWATLSEQALNKRNSPKATFGKETLHVRDWCKRTGIPIHTYYNRRRRGLTPDEIFLPLLTKMGG